MRDSLDCGSGGSSGEVVGVEQEQSQADINLYPNPTTGQFVLHLPGNSGKSTHVSLFDITGRMVFDKTYHDSGNTLTIDSGQLSTGIYVVKVYSENFSKSIKLLVDR